MLPPEIYPFAESALMLRCLDGGEYEVVFWDRAELFDGKVFHTEHEACLYFLVISGILEAYPKVAEAIKADVI